MENERESEKGAAVEMDALIMSCRICGKDRIRNEVVKSKIKIFRQLRRKYKEDYSFGMKIERSLKK